MSLKVRIYLDKKLNIDLDLILEKGNKVKQRNDLFDGTEVIVGTSRRVCEMYFQNGYNISKMKMLIVLEMDKQMKKAWKGFISRMAGLSLYHVARVGTRDATNSFKAYSKSFIDKVGIESDQGFEIGIELVAKARRYRMPVAEIPTIWLDRAFGTSNFKLVAWLPRYLKWYFYAFGAKKKLQ